MARRRRLDPPLAMAPTHVAGVLARLGPALGAYAASAPSSFHLGPTRAETESLAARLAPVARGLRGTGVKELLGVGVAVEQNGRQAKWLGEFLPRLDAARESRLHAGLGERKLEVLRRYLRAPGGDLLGVPGRERSENAHSDLLRWLMDPGSAPHIAPAILGKLVGMLEPQAGWRERLERDLAARSITVRREVCLGVELGSTEAKDRVDVLVASPEFLLAIKKQVGSAEHDNQRESFAEWLGGAPQEILTGGGGLAVPARRKSIVFMDVLDRLLDSLLRGALDPIAERQVPRYVKTLEEHFLRDFTPHKGTASVGGGGTTNASH